MNENTQIKNLKNIRTQIELLKERLDNIDKTLNTQEEVLDLLFEDSKSLLQEASICKQDNNNVVDIMKRAFTQGKLPKILFKK
ncbi:MAG: hypothetical protein HY094_09800 [Candidatus Melainabacteria bacterium]|nr:hypothetical protein [Candidatus Melainabacteria bacterium]